ncbi:M23 family metallopeptidase, partial [Streptomyces niveiscabiei]|uniref:M23 family metallopeptidase n=1 Tax=Streptomyces niveiscabiei TaxID=164115 RepID=UPI0038F74E79
AAGIVTTAVPNGTRGYGRYVVIDHGNGESTLYAHLSTVALGVGQVVDQGALVGTVGETGNATGPHLHFEERSAGKDVAPYFHGA